jgi:katanin p80 WD40 repeat-containing subunit B1
VVVAGSSGGTLKLWDLDQATVVRSLPGHNSNCMAVDFHPYGEFFASGSADTNIKVWDIRKKGCIQTYKGHTKEINSIRFSPDGQWIVSAGEDGAVKLWDLTAGKMLTELTGHTGPVTSLDFHPSELLLASGSADRTVKFWDLESFDLISTTDLDATRVRNINFTPDGRSLLSASQDSLKVWGWEPMQLYDSVNVSWSKLADMCITNDQLVGCSFSQSFVGVWIVNLLKVRPFGAADADDYGPVEGFTSPYAGPPSVEPALNALSIQGGSSAAPTTSVAASSSTSSSSSTTTTTATAMTGTLDRMQGANAKSSQSHRSKHHGHHHHAREGQVPKSSSKSGAARIIPSHSDSPNYLDINRFAQSPAASSSLPTSSSASSSVPAALLSEADIRQKIAEPTTTMCVVLSGRLQNFKMVRNMWQQTDSRSAIEGLVGMNDQAVLVDTLSALNGKHGVYNLDTCAMLLPKLNDLMRSSYDRYQMVALETIHLFIKAFSNLIRANIVGAQPPTGVDLSREERAQKCRIVAKLFSNCRSAIVQLRDRSDEIGVRASDVVGHLDRMLS